ncbi:hypothetical protein D3C76_701450 [compost metagenome]
MSSFNYQKSTLTKYRAGTVEDPFIDIVETKKVINGQIQLNEIPVFLNKVKINDMFEVLSSNNKNLIEDEYRVDYIEGMIYFHPSKEGIFVTCEYKGRGNHFVSYKRIWTEEQDGKILQTLESYIKSVGNLKNCGVYNASTEYKELNIVVYQAKVWQCLQDCVGIEPNNDNVNYWQLLIETSISTNWDNVTGKPDIESHIANQNIHATMAQKIEWDAKETTTGAQTKANTAETNAKNYTDIKLNEYKQDYVRQPAFSVTSGSNVEYTVSLSPSPTNIPEGFGITIVPHVDSGENPTLKIGSLVSIPLLKQTDNGKSPITIKSGKVYTFRKVGTDFLVVNGSEEVKNLTLNTQTKIEVEYSEDIEAFNVVAITQTPEYVDMVFDEEQGLIDLGTPVFSPDGAYLFIGRSKNFTVYKRNGNLFVKLPTPQELPEDTCTGAVFSYDNSYLAITHYGGSILSIYKIINDELIKLEIPSFTSGYKGYNASFTLNGEYLAVATYGEPYLTIFKRVDDTFTKLPGIESLSGITEAYSVSFTANGEYLAVGISGGETAVVYKRNNDEFVKLPHLVDLPNGGYQGTGVSFTPDGTTLVVSHAGQSTSLTVFKREEDRFIKQNLPIITGGGRGVAITSDAQFISVVHYGTPYITLLKKEESEYVLLPKINTSLANANGGVSFSHDGELLAVSYNSELKIYQRKLPKKCINKLVSFQQLSSISNVIGVGYTKEPGDMGNIKEIVRII